MDTYIVDITGHCLLITKTQVEIKANSEAEAKILAVEQMTLADNNEKVPWDTSYISFHPTETVKATPLTETVEYTEKLTDAIINGSNPDLSFSDEEYRELCKDWMDYDEPETEASGYKPYSPPGASALQQEDLLLG